MFILILAASNQSFLFTFKAALAPVAYGARLAEAIK
jgi:hypothetical protein